MQISLHQGRRKSYQDTIFLGMNSAWARDKAINLMNEEGKELTVEFLMQQLEIEDCNAQHKSLSQLDSTTSVNFAACDHRQNRGKSNKSKWASGKDQGQNNSGAHGSSNSSHQSRKPPGMEGKCMRCGKPDHQPGQKCPAKNAKCKDCHKIGHFHKVCQTKKRAKQRANLVQRPPQDDDDTHIDENGVRQPNPPRVNMFKLVNHIEATRGSQEKHLKFPIAKHPKGPCKHHIVVRVDRGADVNCMNGKTFNELFPEDSENLSENREESQIVEPLCTDGTTLEMHLMHLLHNVHHMHHGHTSRHVRTSESQPRYLVIFMCKDTIAPGLVDCQLKMLNFELYIYFIVF